MFSLRTLVKLPRPLRVHISKKATKYLKDVTLQKRCVPFRRHNGGAGRYAQAKHWGWMQDRRPRQNTEFLLHMLKNAKSKAELKGFGVPKDTPKRESYT